MVRGIGLRGAVAVNVITMVGIGPLITIPLVLANLHGSTALIAWIVGGLIALCDGLVYCELGSLYRARAARTCSYANRSAANGGAGCSRSYSHGSSSSRRH